MSLYRQIRNKTRTEQAEILMARGLTAEQAEDWLMNWERCRKLADPKINQGPKFTESEQWKQIQEKAVRLGHATKKGTDK